MKISHFASKKIPYNFIIALKATSAFKIRSLITSFGILFGIASLICLLAAQNGLNYYLKGQEKIIGKNNLVIIPDNRAQNSALSAQRNETDMKSIKEIIPCVETVCNQVSFDVNVQSSEFRVQSTEHRAHLTGVSKDYCSVFNIDMTEGQKFSDTHFLYSNPVCLISSDLKNFFFGGVSPIGKWLRCNDIYLQVIGVFQDNKSQGPEPRAQYTVLSPLQTIMLRFSNPVLSGQSIIVHFNNAGQISQSEKIIERLLIRRHNNIKDFKIINPLQILKKGTRNRRIAILVFTFVTVLCLFTSGIGIMNHITASGYERLNEIVLHISKGFSTKDILLQFLFQAGIISFLGGLLGIILGIISTKIFYDYTKFIMKVSFSSILISFAVSILIGIIFSYLPARKIINDL